MSLGRWIALLLLLGTSLGCGTTSKMSAPSPDPRFDGRWALVTARSTTVDPWDALALRIDAGRNRLTLVRTWTGAYGITAADSMTISVDGAWHRVPLPQWPDNRHIGAFLAGDSVKTVTARWLDDGRTLRVRTRLPVRTSQGPHQIRIYREYRLAPDGEHLTVLGLRSTRPRPIHRVFERAAPE